MRWKVLSYMRNLNGDSIGGKLNTFEEARDFAHKYVVENLDAHLEYLKCRNPEYRRLKLLAEKNNKYNSQLIDWGNKIIKHYTK